MRERETEREAREAKPCRAICSTCTIDKIKQNRMALKTRQRQCQKVADVSWLDVAGMTGSALVNGNGSIHHALCAMKADTTCIVFTPPATAGLEQLFGMTRMKWKNSTVGKLFTSACTFHFDL